VKSLAHPGGNATGLTFVTVDLASKRIQLLKEAIPSAKRVAILWNPNNTINKLELKEATTTAEALSLTPFLLKSASSTILTVHSPRWRASAQMRH
jgi:putative ABC transport system substrate-binding protein